MPNNPDASGDAYRTLGLQPGASKADVKRAYRLLAKAFHPDSAGEAALPRFLAIHEAYDRLTTGRASTGGARASRPAQPPAPEPWRADPARARQARERASSARGGAGRAGAGAPGSTTNGHGWIGKARGDIGVHRERAIHERRTGLGRRHVRKATMGSTSYDEARDANDPTWSGASWYGPSSGEYWIVNPREYADPRKHGPAYQSRARRPLAGETAEAQFEGAEEATATATATGAPSAPASEWTAPAPQAGTAARSSRWGSSPSTSAWSAPAGDRAAPGRAGPPGADEPRNDSATNGSMTEARAGAWLGGSNDDPIHRLGLALVAWPPIGLAAAALIGDATGCASYSAACGGVEPILPWLAQAAIVGLLLLLPALARILAGGAIAMVLLLVPVTLFLVAIGGAGAAQLGFASSILLGIAWLVGVAWSTRTLGEPRGGSAGA